MSNLGWECPRCHVTYAPFIWQCQRCEPQTPGRIAGSAEIRPCACGSSAAREGVCLAHPVKPVTTCSNVLCD